jgi:hypothetical protein
VGAALDTAWGGGRASQARRCDGRVLGELECRRERGPEPRRNGGEAGARHCRIVIVNLSVMLHSHPWRWNWSVGDKEQGAATYLGDLPLPGSSLPDPTPVYFVDERGRFVRCGQSSQAEVEGMAECWN